MSTEQDRPEGSELYMLQFRQQSRLRDGSVNWIDMWGAWHRLETAPVPPAELVRMHNENGGIYRVITARVERVIGIEQDGKS